MNKFVILLIFLNLYNITSYIINNYPFIIGKLELRSTNDPSLLNKYTYLIINDDDTIKLKTIFKKSIFALKISRTGKIKIIKNSFNFFKNFDNDINLFLNYTNVNKYSYSIFGIEIPEFRYEQITDYKLYKCITVKQKDNCLFVTDSKLKYYYIFDINNVKKNLPYIDITLFTLISTQITSFLINTFFLMLYNNLHK